MEDNPQSKSLIASNDGSNFEDNFGIEVVHFSDYHKLQSYLEGNKTINFIVVTSEENAKGLMDHINSMLNVTDVFVYSQSDLNSKYPKIRNTCTPSLSALQNQINKAISLNRNAKQSLEYPKQKIIKFKVIEKLDNDIAMNELDKNIEMINL